MRPDIEDILAYELKEEIAEKYYGFRKLSVSESADMNRRLVEESVILEKRICFDLIRIYFLFKDKILIRAFLNLVGLDEKFFFDTCLCDSPIIRDRVFAGVRARGWTRAGRFKRLLFDCYDRLAVHVELYRRNFARLLDNREILAEELFDMYRKNELGSVLGFLWVLGGDQAKDLQGGIETAMAGVMKEKAGIEPVLPIEQYLPVVPPLPPLRKIKAALKGLIKNAWDLHRLDAQDAFNKKKFLVHPLDRRIGDLPRKR